LPNILRQINVMNSLNAVECQPNLDDL